jgi:ribosomal protein S18 acetylase RimI-like enzyme
LEECKEGVRALIIEGGEFRIVDVAREERDSLERLLEESFTGLYLWHSKKTLKEIEFVRAATIDQLPVGLVMLKMMNESCGYVYYIAVSKEQRRMKIGGRLLDDSLDYLSKLGAREAYASVSEDNAESEALFGSRNFRPIGYNDLASKYGKLHALKMYKQMLVVPGEILLCAEIRNSEHDEEV